MSTYGTVIDYTTGEDVRPATASEWRRYADELNSGAPYVQIGGRRVRIHGGPENKVYSDDMRALRDEAGGAGDLEMVSLCEQALSFTGYGDSSAFDECTRIILDNRMRVAEDA
jgi:hypothetical protein